MKHQYWGDSLVKTSHPEGTEVFYCWEKKNIRFHKTRVCIGGLHTPSKGLDIRSARARLGTSILKASDIKR